MMIEPGLILDSARALTLGEPAMRFRTTIWIVLSLLFLGTIVCVVGRQRQRGPEFRGGDYVEVQASGIMADKPISGVYRIDEYDGKITLGPVYGRVAIAGMGIDEATTAIKAALSKLFSHPQVVLSRVGSDSMARLEVENDRLALENAILRQRLSGLGVASSGR
jgi:hypothetical protein